MREMKAITQRTNGNNAYFVREPEIIEIKAAPAQLETELARDEPWDITKRRLRYKIDRGEYQFTDWLYAQRVWDLIETKKIEIPERFSKRWHDDVLLVLRDQTEKNFRIKFSLEDTLQSLPKEDRDSSQREIENYLRGDLERRAAVDPLNDLPGFLIKVLEEFENDAHEE